MLKTSVKSDMRTLRRIALIFRPYRREVILLLVTIVISTLLGLVAPLLIRAIFDTAIARHDLTRLVVYSIALFVAPVIASFIAMKQAIVNTRMGQSVVRDIRLRLYTHLQHMSLRFYTSTKAGEIQSRLTNDVNGVQAVVKNTAPSLFSTFATVLSSAIAMFIISPSLTLLSFLILPVFVLIGYRTGTERRVLNRQRQENLAGLSTVINQTLSMNGMLLLKSFGRQEQTSDQFEKQSDQIVELEVRQQLVWRKAALLFGVVFAAIPALAYLVGGWQMIRGQTLFGMEMSAGTLIAFTTLQIRLFGPTAQLFLLQSDLQGGLAMFDRIFEYLDLPIDIADRPGAVSLRPSEVRGEVMFEDVAFTYPHRPSDAASPANGAASPAVLERISFVIPPGEVVALVGPSGAGKTTIAQLVPRFYDVDRGAVRIDGHDVRDISLSSLAALVGVVTQETYLLHGTVRENLLYAKPDATMEEMIAATKTAAIHDHIMTLARGYDTVIGEQGYKFSGGEKQRLAIARVVLKNPPVLILDEATSALDAQSERVVQEAFDRLVKGRATLVIAHRLSTVISAGTILVIDKGCIVERGVHAELLARGGLYARLYRHQFSATEGDAGSRTDDPRSPIQHST